MATFTVRVWVRYSEGASLETYRTHEVPRWTNEGFLRIHPVGGGFVEINKDSVVMVEGE